MNLFTKPGVAYVGTAPSGYTVAAPTPVLTGLHQQAPALTGVERAGVAELADAGPRKTCCGSHC